MVKKPDEPPRTPAGRHVTPLGIRTGGKAWLQIHSSIAAASLEVLAESGWGLFTVEGVADRAGVSKRTVYRHYPDKESLAVAGIRILPTYEGWGMGEGTTYERLATAIALGSLFPRYLAPVLSTCIVHRIDVPALMETLVTHVLNPRIKAVDAALERGRTEGDVKQGITGFQVEALFNGLMLAEHRGAPEMNTPTKRTALMADTIWTFISK